MKGNRYLGLDLSTQSITAIVLGFSEGDIRTFQLNFDETFPEYGTSGGVFFGKEPGMVHSYPLMWIEALDAVMSMLRNEGLASSISCMGVSAQQHGTVYLNSMASSILGRLDPALSMKEQLEGIFSRDTSPVWMDSSTRRECEEITDILGGKIKVAELTGSVATERFAGPQIRKFWKEEPLAYKQTGHIALVSSFVTSLLAGKLVPVDTGDGFGTNLADVRTCKWSERAANSVAPDLAKKLPFLVKGDKIVGSLSEYLVKRYGFSPETTVITGSGDNPSSLAGLGMVENENIKAISLGTSDTYFGYQSELIRKERSEGHIFGAADGRYMFLLCFSNGSLAREGVKKKYGLSWEDFSDILEMSRPGNSGRIMLPWFLPEITPLVLEKGIHTFGGLEENDVQASVQAFAEAQAMSMFIHSQWPGARPAEIVVTAGGSRNRGLLKVISRVFGIGVRTLEISDSAALGAALRAAKCHMDSGKGLVSWAELTKDFSTARKGNLILPDPEEVKVYQSEGGLINLYRICERWALSGEGNPEEAISHFRKKF